MPKNPFCDGKSTLMSLLCVKNVLSALLNCTLAEIGNVNVLFPHKLGEGEANKLGEGERTKLGEGKR